MENRTITKRTTLRTPSAGKKADPVSGLRQALIGRKKTELLDILLELAREDRGILRQLKARFDVTAPPNELVAASRQAIADATYFNQRDIGRNFDYDYEAYAELKRNLDRLVDQGHLRTAMKLSLDLMKAGSRQVEMSDEGLMVEEIEDCLRVVLKALKGCELPTNQVAEWCSTMVASDRVGCIASKEIRALQSFINATTKA